MAGPNMQKDVSLAGQSVKQGDYTVTYNERGYATKAVKDGGSSATSTVQTTHANDSEAHQKAYQAAQSGDWDAVGNAVNEIAYGGSYDPAKGYDFTDANAYLRELQDEFKYNANDYYNQKYDDTYGAGSSNVWDATNGAVKTIDQWNQLTGGAAVPTQSGGFGTAGGSYGVTGGGYDYTPNGDAYQYIQDMYAANSASQLAALKAAYEQNVMDYNAQDDLISKQAQQLRNQAASQNDLQRMYMNEMGIMQGLNTGATGQMALAQSAALQGSFADIGTQEQQALADSALERSKLKVQYSAAVDQAIAQNNYELANALYQEYVRQDTLAQQAAAAAQEQANWQAQFDYQKQQDAWTNAAAQAELLAGFGDFSGYKALGYSDAQIAMMQNAWNAQMAAQKSTKISSSGGSGSIKSGMTLTTAKDMAKNGQFTDAVLNTLRSAGYTDEYLSSVYGWNGGSGTVDVGTADAGYNSSYFNAAMSSMRSALDQGHAEGALSGLNSMWGKLSGQQKNQVQQLLSRYGIAYEEG